MTYFPIKIYSKTQLLSNSAGIVSTWRGIASTLLLVGLLSSTAYSSDIFVDEFDDFGISEMVPKATESSSESGTVEDPGGDDSSQLIVQPKGIWDVRLEIGSDYDDDWDRRTSITPRIRYLKGDFRTHLSYSKPVSPESEKGSTEWQIDYKVNNVYRIRNEIDYSFERERTIAEFSNRFRYRVSRELYYGLDLKIEYYDSRQSQALDIHEVDLETSVNRTFYLPHDQKIGFELEVPKFRLYSKGDDVGDSVDFKGADLTLGYVKKLPNKSSFQSEIDFSFDPADDETSAGYLFAISKRL